MVNSFLKLAASRRTAYEFSSKPVPYGSIGKILEAGRWAPSALNSQPWHFLVVQNKKAIAAFIASAYYGAFHGEPAAIIAIVLPREVHSGKPHRGIVKGEIGMGEALLSVAMPAYSMALEATELRLASCIISLDESLLPASLGLRQGDSIPLAIGLGYTVQSGAKGGTHTRKPMAKIVHRERFRMNASGKRRG